MASNGLPFLPGYSVDTRVRTNFAKSHAFDVANGLPVTDKRAAEPIQPGLEVPRGGEPTPTERLSVSTRTGRKDPTAVPMSQLPAWVVYDRKVLRFFAFFREKVDNSALEDGRVRRLILYFYLEDDSLHIAEPKNENSGIPQGIFLKRHRIPKNDSEYLGVLDLKVGSELSVYGRTIVVIDADEATRRFYSEQVGVEQPVAENWPSDKYSEQRVALEGTTPLVAGNPVKDLVEASLGKIMRADLAKTKQFLANDRKVLRFFCVWQDPNLYGEKNHFIIHFFKADDTVEVLEVSKPNAGKDKYPALLKRSKLPKVFRPAGTAAIGCNTDDDSTDYYNESDLRIGEYITVYNRHMLITRADPFTENYYKRVHGLTDGDFEPIEDREEVYVAPAVPPPPYNGFGTEEDSLGSFLSLVPKPPRKDNRKLMANSGKSLRFNAKLVTTIPEDVERRFIVSFFMEDDSVSVFEPQQRNSGFVSGKFLERRRIKNSQTDAFFKPTEFFVGAQVVINSFHFQFLEADEGTLNFMEERSHEFPFSDIEAIISILSQQIAASSSDAASKLSEYDANSDNKLTPAEFQSLVNNYGWPLNAHQCLIIFRHFDSDGNGFISGQEFFNAVKQRLQ